ncbi:MAG: hypothetical protein AAFV53_03935 [Myxococcota bacterium]
MYLPRLITLIALIGFVAPAVSHAGDGPDHAAHAQDPLQVYANSRYDYCDAKMLSIVWKNSVYEAKVTIGQKIINGLTGLADQDIATGRQQALNAFESNPQMRCNYMELGYSYEDAAKLANVWGLPGAWEAKQVIERKYLFGDNDYTRRLLSQANNSSNTPTQAQLFQAYAASYDYCDAKMIALVWKSSINDAKLTLGRKVMGGMQGLAAQDIANGRQQALAAFETNRGVRCHYHEAGYDYNDAELLATYWGLPNTWEAKMTIERKLLFGNKDLIKQALENAKRG